MPQLSKYFPPAAKIYLQQNLKVLRESDEERSLKGAAYAVAGLFKGLGMKAIIELDVLGEFSRDVFA